MKSKFCAPSKPVTCRYHGLPGGCARGDRCFYAHGEDLGRRRSADRKESKTPLRVAKAASTMQELRRKVFIGGLSPLVNTGHLLEFFEERFGSVTDAIVIESLSGDRVQSRGFGFVTFKHEASLVAAVEARYVTLLGKKVEIKAAIPRDCMVSNIAGEARFSYETLNKSPSLECLQRSISGDSFDLGDSFGSDVHISEGTPSNQHLVDAAESIFISDDEVTPQVPCSWMETLKKWLPRFLQAVSKRLGEGEYYPLSSLKGDFRATCGLELDHTSLGYQKLSDFIRSMPELCQMKIVPVSSTGPATHIVLVPQIQEWNSIPALVPIATTRRSLRHCSLVKAGRSYAAVAAKAPDLIEEEENDLNADFDRNRICLYGDHLHQLHKDNEADFMDTYTPSQLRTMDRRGRANSIVKPSWGQSASKVLLWDQIYAAPFASNLSFWSPRYKTETEHMTKNITDISSQHASMFTQSLSSFLFGGAASEQLDPNGYKLIQEESPQSVLSLYEWGDRSPSTDNRTNVYFNQEDMISSVESFYEAPSDEQICIRNEDVTLRQGKQECYDDLQQAAS